MSTPLPSGIEVLDSFPENTPLFMLNLVKFNEKALYEPDSKETSVSGKEAYFGRYIPAFRKVAANLGGVSELVYAGHEVLNVISSPDDDWDIVALVRYKDIAAFKAVVVSEEYAEKAKPHREAAIKKWKLLGSHQFTP